MSRQPPKPGQDSTADVPAALVAEIRALLDHGRAQDAHSRTAQALARQPRSAPLRCLLAEALVALGYADDALRVLEAVRAEHPQHRRAEQLITRIVTGNADATGPNEVPTADVGAAVAPGHEQEDEDTINVGRQRRPEVAGRYDGMVGAAPPRPHPAPAQRVPSAMVTVDADVIEEDEDPTGPAIPMMRPDGSFVPGPGKLVQPGNIAVQAPRVGPRRPSGQLTPAMMPAQSEEDDTFGTFNELSSDILKGAEQAAHEMGFIEAPKAPGIDSYLANVIGMTPAAPVTGGAPFSPDETGPTSPGMVERAAPRPSQASTAIAKPRASAPAMVPQRPTPGPLPQSPPARPGPLPQPPPAHPTPGPLPQSPPPRTTPAPLPQMPQAAQPAPAVVPPMPSDLNSSPGLVVDRGFDEEDPTLNIDQKDAREAIERAMREHGAALDLEIDKPTLAQQQAYSPPPIKTHHKGPVPGAFQVPRVVKRSAAICAIFYGAYLLLWLPFSWESRLCERMDELLMQGREAWEQDTFQGTEKALSAFGDVETLAGSRIGAFDSLLKWYTESLLARDHLSLRRDAARLEAAFVKAHSAAHFDPAQGSAAEDALRRLSDAPPLAHMARAYLHDNAGNRAAALADVEGLRKTAIPSARLYTLVAELELRQHRAQSARSLANAALQLRPRSIAARLIVAQSYAETDVEKALAEYEDVLKLSSRHPVALLRRSLLRLEQGEAPEEELVDLVLANPSVLGPRQKAQAMYGLAQIASERGRADEAEDNLQAALELDPREGEIHAALIKLYMDQGRSQSAEQVLRKALDSVPEHPSVRLRQAELLLHAGDVRAGSEVLAQLAETHWPSAERLAVVALEHHDIERARTLLAKAAELAPPGVQRRRLAMERDILAVELSVHDRGWAEAQARLGAMRRDEKLTLAWALVVRGEHTDIAQQIFEQVLASEPTQPSALAGRCALLAAKGSENLALKVCGEALALAGSFSPAAQAAGRTYLRLERYADAFNAFARVQTSYPNLEALRGGVASALMLWKFDEASAYLDQWLTSYGASTEQDYWAGRLALQRGDIDQAREYLARATEPKDTPAGWRPFYAEALYESGSFSKAKLALRGLTEVKDGRAGAELVLSFIALSERRPTTAKDHARRALTNADLDHGGARQRSRALVSLALAEAGIAPNADTARTALTEAIRVDPLNVDAYYQLGLLEKSRNRTEAARQQFEAALAVYPNHEPSRKALLGLK